MFRSAGLWRAVVQRIVADRLIVLAAALLLLCATTLLAAGVIYGDAVALAGLRRTLVEAAPADRGVSVTASASVANLPGADSAAVGALSSSIGSRGGEVDRVVTSGPFARAGTAPGDTSNLTALASYEDIERHARLVAGRWPEPAATPTETTLSEPAAHELGMIAGDTVSLVDRLDPSHVVELKVVGLWAADADDAYWRGAKLELQGVETRGSFTTRGPFVLPREDLLGITGHAQLTLEWRAFPHPEALRVSDVEPLGREVAALRDALRGASRGVSFSVTSSLPAILAEIARSIVVVRSGVLLVSLQFGALAAYAVVLVAGMLADRRRPDVALLRARGASSAHLAAMSVAESLLLAIPAGLAGPWVAAGVVRLIAGAGSLADPRVVVDAGVSATAIAVSLLAALGCVAGLALAGITAAASPGGVRAALGRGRSSTLAQRFAIDLVLIVLAAVALWQLRLYGSALTRDARGVLGLDPVLSLAPALGLVTGGLVAIRLFPRLAELAERLLGSRGSLVLSLGSRQLARRPLRYTRSVLLLMLAAALGTLAGAHAATWQRSQADQADYAAAADIRVTPSQYSALPTQAAGAVLRGVPGVQAAMPVLRSRFTSGGAARGAELLGLDAVGAGPIVRARSESGRVSTQDLLARLGGGRPSDTGLALPDAPRALAVTFDAVLGRAIPLVDPRPGPVGPPNTGHIDLAVVLEDADGLHRVVGGSGVLVGTDQRIEVLLNSQFGGAQVPLAGPVRLVSIEFSVTPPDGVTAVGTLDIRRLEVSGQDEDWRDIAFDPRGAGWSWLRVNGETTSKLQYATPAGIVIGPRAAAIGGVPLLSPATYRLWQPPEALRELPVVAGDRFLGLAGAEVGDLLPAAVAGDEWALRVVGRTDRFPPLDPAAPFVIADARSVQLHRFALTGETLGPAEWWLAVDERQSGDIVQRLSDEAYGNSAVVARAVLTRNLTSDPFPLGVIGAFALGSLAATLIAAIGSLVGGIISTGEREGEFALLRALGLSSRALARWLTVENAVLLTFALLAGSALGLLLSWLVLPFATFTATGAPPVPAPIVVVPWEPLVPLCGVAAGLLLVTGFVAARRVPGVDVGGILRAGDT